MNIISNIPQVMVVDDELEIRRLLIRCLQPLEISYLSAENGTEALKLAREHMPEVVLLDIRLPDKNGLDVMEGILRNNPNTSVIILTAFDDSRIAVEAIKKGAMDYLTKPVDVDTLQNKVKQVLEYTHMRRSLENYAASEVTPISFHGMIGRSQAIRKVFSLMQKLGPTDAPVLIEGESGTGKRMVAEILHRLSPRREGPFIVVDCGTLPLQLMESELFGHEKGAFTSADQRHIGHMEKANYGTIFLDEITNLTSEGQAKLLRFLDEKVICRLGSTEPIYLDVRVLAASNLPVEEQIKSGRFREDLYYRLNVFEIHLPPLRERLEDIPLLAEYFVTVFRDKYAKPTRGFRPEVMARFLAHPWTGNVRELRNIVERAVALCDEWITTSALPESVYKGGGLDNMEQEEAESFRIRARRIMEETEQRLIQEALERAGGNRQRAADLLGISVRSLYYKIEKYFPKHDEV